MLTSKQRAYLRSVANNIDTILIIGKSGLNEKIIKQADDALTAREIFKGKILDTVYENHKEIVANLAEATCANIVQIIGSKFNNGEEDFDEFRIPDYNITEKFLQPGKDVGNQITAGLPNITGGNTIVSPYNSNTYGAFAKTTGSQNISGGGEWYSISNFDASRSSDIYGNSSAVQPQSQIVHICIKYR